MDPPWPENHPEAWCEEFDEKKNAQFFPFFDDNLGEPKKI